jgi:beta-1,4-mannooligosaccharide/beta-1,4-mannosyl-N-acetylglucosamine phosphorylase
MVKVHAKKQIVTRYPGNPIITAEMMPFSCRGVYNSTAVRFQGRYHMVLRAEGFNLRDTFWLAASDDGYRWTVGEQIPLPDTPEYREFGDNQYDPRLTRIDDTFYMTFCVHGSAVRMGLMSSRDLRTFRWEGFITGNGYRNTVLFPERVGGLYAALERPNEAGEIWVTQSPDLHFWGNQHRLLTYQQTSWSWHKIGPCGTPIKTERGWLILFHGVQTICEYEFIYHTGVMLTDLSEPWRLISKGDEPILSPMEPYELAGHAPNVVFASSQVVEDDGRVKLYYGASDRYQCVADTTVDLLLEAALTR